MVIFVLMTLVGFQQEGDPFKIGLNILREEGSEEAISYFEELVELKNDPRSFYLLAWSLWEGGDTDEAEFMADILIENETKGRILADAYYLRGIIENEKIDPTAIEYFDRAIDIYSEIGANGSLYRSYCGIAASLIFQGKEHEATTFLEKALIFRKKSKKGSDNTAYYHELYSRAFFGLGDYSAALEKANEGLAIHEKKGNIISYTETLSTVALLETLTGNPAIGLKLSKDVDEILRENPDPYRKLIPYHFVNWVILFRCLAKDYSYYEESIRNYVGNSGDKLLKKHLIFGLQWNCLP